MSKMYLEKFCVDLGYPDPGHDEWKLVKSEKRKSKILQMLFGDKKTDLIHYGEWKPDNHQVQKDVLRFSKGDIEKEKLLDENKRAL